MARITVEDCLEKVENQYDLVLLAKERTVQLNAGSQILVEEDNDKRTIISLREIGDGKVPVQELKESAIKENKDASIQIAVDSVKKIITTSVDKSKLDPIFQKNWDETKEELKKINS